jgi:hypothetical protein
MIPWYIPSFHGDIRLTAKAPKETLVAWEKLTAAEETALRQVSAKLAFPGEESKTSGDVVAASGEIVVPYPIEKVQKAIARAMKRGRQLVTAVTFSGGKVEEVALFEEAHENRGALEKIGRGALAGVTVAAPTIGCPSPEFEKAEVRATRVLSAFLTPEQLEDFNATQQFVVTGIDSGHKYLLTSRTSPKTAEVGGRSVYDLDEERPVCVHDWMVPAAEELLELKLFLTLEGREKYVRSLPEA